ncbi:RNA polymerase sigma factor [Dysgonomonas sp. 25]|uniref:RNA polymerase sigma factor n=1 Tax=Dysgonomonas sp. 25 TaxID=2302933 RepID=UPI0013D4BD0A|nr:RNA polymerase sigma factor [Dysgonomonas sp. 25]NDV67341.1 RNA polymerase sigma factor [Dysgonomonas sp. 25]
MDAEIFKQKFLPYHQKLYRIAFRIVQNEANAQDIVQDTYIKLWEKRDQLTDLNSPEAFAITMLKNLCLDFLRSPNAKRKEEYIPTMKAHENNEDIYLPNSIEMRDEANYIRELIKKLPEQQRLVIMYKDWDGYSTEEIETMMGLSTTNVRVILSRARKTVREQYLKLCAG